MKSTPRLGRRQLLRAAIMLGALLTPCLARPMPVTMMPSRALLATLALHRYVHSIGRAYLAQPDGLARTKTFLHYLDQMNGPTVLELHAQLAAAVQADFEAGRIAVVNGWHLAQTEAKLCSAVFLCHGRDLGLDYPAVLT